MMREQGFSLTRFRAVMRAALSEPEPLIQRAEHFHVENQVVLPAAMGALSELDWTTFGELVDESQEAAATLLGNQVPETNHLAESARRLGAVAASSFGAGFGGAVWALVLQKEVDAFQAAWRGAYAARFPDRAESARFFVERPGPAAFQL
jgi:galactokinase